MKQFRTELKWGFVFFVMTLAWMAFERAMGWHDQLIEHHATYTNFFALPAILLYIFALREKKNIDLKGDMTYWQGFKSGVIISLIVTVLSPLGQWITHTLISPEYFPTIISYTAEQNIMTIQEAEAYFSLSNYMIQSSVGALIMGILTTAIVTIFIKTKWK